MIENVKTERNAEKSAPQVVGAGGARDREKHGAGYLTQTNRLFLIRFSLAMCESQRLEIPIRKIICFMHDSCIHFSCFAIRAPHEIERMRDRKSIYIVKWLEYRKSLLIAKGDCSQCTLLSLSLSVSLLAEHHKICHALFQCARNRFFGSEGVCIVQ